MLRLGPAGSGGLGNLEGIEYVREKGLDALEVEFTYGVYMPNDAAKTISKRAKELAVSLSVHAPYYINLASKEKEKVAASKKRIIDSAEKAHLLGAGYVVFHAGFYQDRTADETYRLIRNEVEDILKAIKKKRWAVQLAPETTGKKSQFGSLDELLALHGEIGSSVCVDFAHILAREGKIDYKNVFDKLKNFKTVHSHFSGIEYGDKGERKHRITSRKDLMPLLTEIARRDVDITIINESPDPVRDCIKTKKLYRTIKAAA
ncbi:MAG: TIM barrel protein [Candidatus Omnitrophota bacterium]